MIKYIFFLIIPFLFIPSAYGATFTDTTADSTRLISTAGAFNNCNTVSFASTNAAPRTGMGVSTDATGSCSIAEFVFDTTLLPDYEGFGASEINIEFDVTSSTSITDCKVWVYNNYPTRTDTKVYEQVVEQTGIDGSSVSSVCNSVGDGKVISLQGSALIEAFRLAQTQDELALIISFDEMIRDSILRDLVFRDNDAVLTIYYDLKPDAITDLTITETRATGVTLSWSQPNLNGGALRGYAINNTTPFGIPLTILTLNTTNSATTAQISDLTGSTQYTFRVSALTNYTGYNATGNKVNTTTLFDPTAAYTPGSFNLTDTGTDIRDIRFDEIRISDTSSRLNVTFPNTFTNLQCDFDYQFAQQNRTYGGLDSIVSDEDTDYNETSFLFTNMQNEIITAYCWEGTTGNGTYIITQSSNTIPFVALLQNYTNGEYGTAGDFGGIDLISLLVFGVIATIGFNNKNEAVGAVFLFILTFSLWWFEIIQLPTAMGGIIAVVLMLVIMQVRKD